MAEQAAKNKRATSKRCFTRAESALRAALDNPESPTETITRRFGDFKLAYTEVETSHETYLNTVSQRSR